MSYSREGVLIVGGASLALLAWASSRFVGGGDSMLQPVVLIVGGSMMCLAALLLLLEVFQQ